MKTITNKIKQIGRKYIAPVALAGTFALGSYGCGNKTETGLPIYPEVRDSIMAEQNREYEVKQREIDSTLEEMTNDYNSTLNSARNKFNEYVAQRDIFTVDEQEKILNFYEKVGEIREGIRNYAKKNGREKYSDLNLPEKDFQAYWRLNANLNGTDLGNPELEISLKGNGIDIEVEPKDTEADTFAGFMAFFVLAGGILGTGCAGIYAYDGLSNLMRKRNRK